MSAITNEHSFDVRVTWAGNQGTGTSNYRAYGRQHVVSADGPPPIEGSAATSFRGDADRWNPEQLLVAALSQCHMLWYLHFAATNGVIVVAYADDASGVLTMNKDGSGEFTSAVLRPHVTVTDESMVETAIELHHRAPAMCFIARSVNFSVTHEPTISVVSAAE